ncbi:uncharacterized protein G2W53_036669 [Senna tora]|uniref:Uncharacterized protein n=1 Tax=Senna tora TaxID=362788 RepID=A0A834SVK8_9FABA|nr:uncharacterized protein G2W53_036669 [Senna tora]
MHQKEAKNTVGGLEVGEMEKKQKINVSVMEMAADVRAWKVEDQRRSCKAQIVVTKSGKHWTATVTT